MLNFFMVAHSASCHTLSKAFLKSMTRDRCFSDVGDVFHTGFLG